MKISQLPQASAETNEDVLPIVQNGETKKVTRKMFLGNVPDGVSVKDGKLQLIANGKPVGGGAELPVTTVDQTVTEGSKNAVSGGAVKECVDTATRELEKGLESERNAREDADNKLKGEINNAANAVKGSAKGESLLIDDVSPIEHEIDITLSSKNMFNYDWPFGNAAAASTKISIEKGENAITFICKDNGSYFRTIDPQERCFNFKPNTTYTSKAIITLTKLSEDETLGVSYTTTIYLSHGFTNENGHSPIYLVNGMSATKYGTVPGTYEVVTTFTTPEDLSPYKYLNIRMEKFTSVRYESIMICEGTESQDYVPYADVSNVEVTRTGYDSSNPEAENVQTAVSDEDGKVKALTSFSPEMSIVAKTPNIVLHCEYNKDLNKVIEQLTQAILSLGGDV